MHTGTPVRGVAALLVPVTSQGRSCFPFTSRSHALSHVDSPRVARKLHTVAPLGLLPHCSEPEPGIAAGLTGVVDGTGGGSAVGVGTASVIAAASVRSSSTGASTAPAAAFYNSASFPGIWLGLRH
jgi:hypothetical protein